VLVGRNPENLGITADKVAAVSKSIEVLVQPTDVSDELGVKKLFEKVKAKFDQAHILINAAGTMGSGMMGDAPLASWWRDFVRVILIHEFTLAASNPLLCRRQEINVKGTFLPIQSFIQNFGGEGTIINLVSVAVAMDAPGISSYASSKLAVVKMSQALSLGK